ncbi:hypothetical protein [Chryseobacterium sp. NKUCC03_KSP]|uniref:hypothetical protein n=1 Tax=Chryseobacterium sp. NKUCC03_KSP TaxID=2842125 RepID=UPI001C5A83C5|nr:hypothetical protein [Chryseobacterium sp. NKUCC03_KSP]MBW3521752.1 hypothetical protein [Chryseobacterium sp. NKUCC03_KSP]
MVYNTESFLWSQMWKEKKFPKTTKGILNIPAKQIATCLMKCEVRTVRSLTFWQSGCTA